MTPSWGDEGYPHLHVPTLRGEFALSSLLSEKKLDANTWKIARSSLIAAQGVDELLTFRLLDHQAADPQRGGSASSQSARDNVYI